MFNFTDRQIAIAAMIASVLSTVIATLAYRQSQSQFDIDYDAAVNISPGTLPVKVIPSDKSIELNLLVTNTSKTNLKYFVQAESNAACLTGESARSRLIPCMFESRIITLSKPEAGAQSHTHKLTVKAPTSVDMPALAYSSAPIFYLALDVLDESNGRRLFRSKCFYTFQAESKSLVLYEPVMDTTQQGKSIQSECGI